MNIPHNDMTAGARAPTIVARPFEWQDPATLPPRAWVYPWHYIRKFVSVTIAPGGVGKSSLVIAEALAMITGRNLLGTKPKEAARVWLWNGEDPIDELQRRVTAALVQHNIAPSEVEGRLFLNSGRDDSICIALQNRQGIQIAEPQVDAITRTIRENAIGVVIVDPFVSSHSVGENDNNAIDRVAKTWARIADATNTSIELVHHSRKNGGAETTVEDGRGAVALLAAARAARVLNTMTKEEAERAGVEHHHEYVRIDDGKANLTPISEASQWFRKVGVHLWNGPGGSGGDSVGVVIGWTWPDPLEDLTTVDLHKVQAAVAASRWRKDSQAKEWVGIAIADTLGLDLSDKANRNRVKSLQRMWTESGALVEFTEKDEKRNERTYVRAGGGREGEAA